MSVFHGDWNEDPEEFLNLYLQCTAASGDNFKARQFINYLGADSDADEWFDDLPQEEKKDWAAIELSFRKKWLKEEVISISLEETVTKNEPQPVPTHPTSSIITTITSTSRTTTHVVMDPDAAHNDTHGIVISPTGNVDTQISPFVHMSSISAVITPPYFEKPMEMPRKPEKPPKDATNKPQHISQPPRRPPEPPQTVTIIATPSATTTAPPSPRAQAYDSKESKLDKMTENSSDEHQKASEEPRTPCGITYDIQRTYESQNDPVFPQMVQKQMFLPQKPSNTSTSLLMTSSTPTRAQTSITIPISPPAPSPAPKPPETSSIHSISSPTPSSHPFSAISSQILAILFALYFFRHSRHFKPAFERFHPAVLKIQSPSHQSNLHPFSVISSQILPIFFALYSFRHSSHFKPAFERFHPAVLKIQSPSHQSNKVSKANISSTLIPFTAILFASHSAYYSLQIAPTYVKFNQFFNVSSFGPHTFHHTSVSSTPFYAIRFVFNLHSQELQFHYLYTQIQLTF